MFDLEQAKSIVENGVGEAQELLQNPSKVDELLVTIEDKLRGVPLAGELLADVPLMIAMIKSYITKQYTDVSVKVIASMVAAFLYLIKRKDLIPDGIPLVGHVDDLAVLGAALKFCEPELKAYKAWRDGGAVNA